MDTELIEAIQEVVTQEWNRKAVNGEQVAVSTNGSIKIAVLDSGVDVTDDIEVLQRVDLINDEAVPFMCEDMTGHGTAVASVIAAKDNGIGITGIAPGLEICSVKILDENNRAPLSRVLAALQWCQENDVDMVW